MLTAGFVFTIDIFQKISFNIFEEDDGGIRMKKLLNTLFVTSEDIYLSLENENIVLHKEGNEIARYLLHIFENILSFSYKGASPILLGKCAQLGIGVSFLTPQGKFLCRVGKSTTGNIYLRKEQFRISENTERSLTIEKNIVTAKLFNAKWVLSRTLREYPMRVQQEQLQTAIDRITQYINDIAYASNSDRLRGIEGNAAAEYFGVFSQMIMNQKEDFDFHGRSRRPPLDNINALLSFAYAMLASNYTNALEAVGLDPYMGFMHADKPGRKSLALDLMEELRAPFADRFVISLINLKQIQKTDFDMSESGAVFLNEQGKKKFLAAWQKKKKDTITHPYLEEKIMWGLVPYYQALLLARSIRGDIDGYPPFMWK